MSPELDQRLREEYPTLFSQPCEISINDGWYDIIDQLCSSIQHHIVSIANQRKYAVEWNKNVNDPEYDWSDKASFIERKEREVPEIIEQVTVTQIKEKFGILRFYYQGGDIFIRGLVSMASSVSSVICEDCGKPGKLRRGGWFRTLCDDHALKKEIDDEFRNRSV